MSHTVSHTVTDTIHGIHLSMVYNYVCDDLVTTGLWYYWVMETKQNRSIILGPKGAIPAVYNHT